jgi:hypothetical protein
MTEDDKIMLVLMALSFLLGYWTKELLILT